jgi:hypothetical protein
MRRRIGLLAAAALVVSLTGIPSSAGSRPERPTYPDQRLDRLVRHAEKAGAGERHAAVLRNFTLVAHSSLDRFRDYGDVFAHGDFAYVGSRCGAARRGGDGVQVVGIRNPYHPTLVSTLSNPRYTRAEDVTVLSVHTPAFTGDLGVVGIQACFGSGHEGEVVPGLRFYDVTNPAHPSLLGHWDLPQGTVGCHEIDAVQRTDGLLLAGCARNLIDHINSNGQDSVHIVDATDPRHPTTLTNWTLGADPLGGVGCLPYQFAHSVRFEDGGQSLYVSNWDAGTVNLDITDPAAPAIVGDTVIVPPDEDGDNHSMTLANGGGWLVINPEDFSPSDCPGESAFGAWGEVYVYDNSDPSNPSFLGTFSTPNSRSTRDDGSFTDHNTEVVRNNQFFSSWYSDGIVWWTMNGQGVSHQRGQFVPPTQNGPAFVWGVFPVHGRNLVLASDIDTGLWIVRPQGFHF